MKGNVLIYKYYQYNWLSILAHPAGFETTSSASMSQAIRRVLTQLYCGMIEAHTPVSDMIPEKDQRNQAVYYRYMAGERAVDLATEYQISVRRVNKLIRRYLKRGQE